MNHFVTFSEIALATL